MTAVTLRSRTAGRHVRRGSSRATFVRLHTRARGVPVLVTGAATVALLAWIAAEWLVGRPWSPGPEARAQVATWAPVLAAVLISSGLGAADEELERIGAVPWRLIRAIHVVAVTVIGGAALVFTGLWEPATYGAYELARNTVASVGLLAISAPVLGARLAWLPLSAYVAVVNLAAPQPLTLETAWWTWPLQPWSASLAAGAAVALFVSGVALYAWFGARPSRDQEAS